VARNAGPLGNLVFGNFIEPMGRYILKKSPAQRR
jgi:hypothetical protein